jgi:hypothetical protein
MTLHFPTPSRVTESQIAKAFPQLSIQISSSIRGKNVAFSSGGGCCCDARSHIYAARVGGGTSRRGFGKGRCNSLGRSPK